MKKVEVSSRYLNQPPQKHRETQKKDGRKPAVLADSKRSQNDSNRTEARATPRASLPLAATVSVKTAAATSDRTAASRPQGKSAKPRKPVQGASPLQDPSSEQSKLLLLSRTVQLDHLLTQRVLPAVDQTEAAQKQELEALYDTLAALRMENHAYTALTSRSAALDQAMQVSALFKTKMPSPDVLETYRQGYTNLRE
ncbi:hypothetical protein HDU91_002639, partial [Kappamyces sp. JEL0680]